MRFRQLFRAIPLVFLAASVAGCEMSNFRSTPTAPGSVDSTPTSSSANTAAFATTWASADASAPASFDPRGCRDFEWAASGKTATSVSGLFSAVCMEIPISGTAAGQLTGANTGTITIDASGPYNGSQCTVTASGQGIIEDRGETLQLTFSGTSCLGPFSGQGTLYRKDLFPPAAPPPPPPPAPEPPAPTPAPTPEPSVEPWETCAQYVNDKPELVDCVHGYIQPGSSGERAFEVTKRVAWLLRHEGGGLLIKNGGENIISWQGYSFSLSRICYPDGHIFKVITDAGDGGTNGPGWADNDYVSPSLYVPAIRP